MRSVGSVRPNRLEPGKWCCQAKANQSPKCATSGFSGRELTPFGERGGAVLLENIAAI